MTEPQDTVLVTGGSGYIGSWTIVELLRQGYDVRATVRSAQRADAVRALLAGHVDAGDRFTFAEADLTSDAGWPAAVDGCNAVLHVASPMPIGEYRGTDLVTPAREGTLRILRASAAAGVRSVVMTSSVAACHRSTDTAVMAGDEEDSWTDLEGPRVNEYTKSKVLAERDAWDFIAADTSPMTLTTVLPGSVQGPVLSADVSGSAEIVSRMLDGRFKAIPNIGFSFVDVRDVVDLHIRAMRSPAAAGERFVAAKEFLWLSDVAALLRERFPDHSAKVPMRRVPDALMKVMALFNADAKQMRPQLDQRTTYTSAKAERLLGWQPRAATASIVDGARSMIDLGIGG